MKKIDFQIAVVAGLVLCSSLFADQVIAPPGYVDKMNGWNGQYLEYRAGYSGGIIDLSTKNVNSATPRSYSTFLPINDTNGMAYTVVRNQIVFTNSGAIFPYLLPYGSSISFTNSTLTSFTVTDLSINVVVDTNLPLGDGSAGGPGWSVTLNKGGANPSLLLDANSQIGNVLWLYSALSANSIINVTLVNDVMAPSHSALVSALDALYTDSWISLWLGNGPVDFNGGNYRPYGGLSTWATFTNATASGSWIINFKNTTAGTFHIKSYIITLYGASTYVPTIDGQQRIPQYRGNDALLPNGNFRAGRIFSEQ